MDFIVEENRISFASPEGETLAEVTFPSRSPSVVDVNRTFVDSRLRGQGVAGELMARLVETLESTGRKAFPTCSYAISWFQKHGEARAVLDERYRDDKI